MHEAGREQYLTVVLCLLSTRQPLTSSLTEVQRAWTASPLTCDELGEGP